VSIIIEFWSVEREEENLGGADDERTLADVFLPSRMVLRKAGAALAAGCCMIVKPSPETPLSVLAVAELATQAGIPKGVFSVLTTSLENTPPLSEALCRHPLIKKVTFTGSVSCCCCWNERVPLLT
jgi:delta 1-pyrroline-5-carboxylate dehydrogenase